MNTHSPAAENAADENLSTGAHEAHPAADHSHLPEGVSLTDHLKQLAYHHENDFRASAIARRLLRYSRGKHVLDAGCGTGRLTLELLRAGREVVAVDHEPDLVQLTNSLVEQAGFGGSVASTVAVEELDRLGEGATFDEVFCCDVIEHVPDDRKALTQIRHLLKPGGRLILTVPAWQFLFNERDRRMGHYRRYNRRTTRQALVDSGFKIDTMRWWNLSGFLLNAIFIYGLKLKFSENFRYRKAGPADKVKGLLLRGWFNLFENNVPIPAGLTLICVAHRD